MRRHLRAAALVALAGIAPAHAADEPRVGVLVPASDEESAACATAFAATLRRARPGAAIVERPVGGEADVAAALAEMRLGRVEVVVALTDAAAEQVASGVREVPLVLATPDASATLSLRRGGNACAVTGPAAAALAEHLRRAVPGLRRLGVLVPAGDGSARANAQDLAAEFAVVTVEAEGDDPAARALGALERLGAAEAIWLPPSVTGADAAALARALEGRAVPLLGSRRRHLDAGCAAVVRADVRDLGAHAAVLALRALAGEDPGRLPVRRLRRRVVEVNLPGARRLRYEVPLLFLAAADEVLRGRTAPR